MNGKQLFQLKNMKIDMAQKIDIESNARVTINGVMFQERIISRIEFVRHKFDDREESIFIEAFMGNILITTVVAKKDYVLRSDKEHTPYYWIEKAELYDYSEVD